MKRIILSVVIAGVLGLAAYTAAGAQGRGPGFGPGRAGGPGFGPGAGFLLRGLDLTDEQEAQVKAIRQAARGDRQGPPAEVSLHQQLQAEILAEVPDVQKIETIRDQIAQAQVARLAKQVEIEQKIAAVLTPEQRARALERLAKRAENRAGSGMRGERPVQRQPNR
jgi:Spy/CpxP family protein refolding chaperone